MPVIPADPFGPVEATAQPAGPAYAAATPAGPLLLTAETIDPAGETVTPGYHDLYTDTYAA